MIVVVERRFPPGSGDWAQGDPLYERPLEPRPRRHWGRRILATACVLILLGVLAGAALLVYASSRVNAKGIACTACSPAPSGASGMNVLVMASDTRQGLSPAEAQRLDPGNVDLNDGTRADSLALVHLEPGSGKAVVISIPRDLRVPAPGGGYEKINAYFNNGPNPMVAEVSSLTGLSIQHFIEVNFVSFGEITQALGGVNVYFNRAINDPNSGLNQPKGCNLLSGDQALAFVRDRDTDSDFGRIARQRLFVTLMMDKVLTPGTLLNPVKVLNLIKLGLNSLTHDSGLSLATMLNLALHFHSFNSSAIDFRVLPVQSTGQVIGGVSYVIENTSQASALMTAVGNGSPLPPYGVQSTNAAPTTTGAASTAPSKSQPPAPSAAASPAATPLASVAGASFGAPC